MEKKSLVKCLGYSFVRPEWSVEKKSCYRTKSQSSDPDDDNWLCCWCDEDLYLAEQRYEKMKSAGVFGGSDDLVDFMSSLNTNNH